jgi:hypothetical protein
VHSNKALQFAIGSIFGIASLALVGTGAAYVENSATTMFVQAATTTKPDVNDWG